MISDPKTLQHGSFELTCRIKDGIVDVDDALNWSAILCCRPRGATRR